ncbi:putative ribonuclease H-like domain-containing protein [Tanacetum coccineum]
MRIFSRWMGDGLRGIGSSMAGGYVDCQKKGTLLENVDLEGIKGEDLIVTMAGAMIQQLHLHHRHWCSRWSSEGSSDEESTPANDRSSKADGYHVVPPPITESVMSNPKIDRDRVIIEDWNSDDEEEEYEVQTVRPETQTVKTRDDKSGQNSKKQGIGFRKIENMVNTSQREGKPVWDNTKRVNHQNFSKYPHLSKTFVPSGVLTRTGLHRPSVSTARPSVSTARPVCTARPSVSTARPVCTARPSVSTARPVYATRPYLTINDMDNVKTKKGLCSTGIQEGSNRTCWTKKAVVNTGKGKLNTDLKRSRWVWRPKGNYLDHVSKDSGSFMLKKDNPEILLQDHAVVDSLVALDIMTGNKALSSVMKVKLYSREAFLERMMLYSLDLRTLCDNETEFKNHAMNEFCAKKGIKREFSIARTPQQNGVAERKNRDPYLMQLEHCKSPSINFMRPFGCPLTILNTLDSLGKFDGKSDEGYLLGYSISSKAFRVYNKRTKRVEENPHINFLEDQPNVTGTGPNWMFDLNFLTNSINYSPVSVENQVNVDAGIQDSYVAGSSGKDKGPTQEYILLPLQPHRTRIPIEDVAPAAHEKPFKSSPKDNDV